MWRYFVMWRSNKSCPIETCKIWTTFCSPTLFNVADIMPWIEHPKYLIYYLYFSYCHYLVVIFLHINVISWDSFVFWKYFFYHRGHWVFNIGQGYQQIICNTFSFYSCSPILIPDTFGSCVIIFCKRFNCQCKQERGEGTSLSCCLFFLKQFHQIMYYYLFF